MATIKIRWHVDELANVMSNFDVQKVYRSTTGPEGPWTEITTVATRVPLVVGVENYFYDDGAGDPSYYYAISYYNTSTTHESSLSEPKRGDLSGYVSIQDVRDEGFTDPPWTDARIISAIELATATIDTATKMWFEPRQCSFLLDGRKDVRGIDFLLSLPICAVTKLTIYDLEQEIEGSFRIYNRHLTQGLTRPDDRSNPRVSFDFTVAALDPANPIIIEEQGIPFIEGRQNIGVEGVFGYTTLGPNDPVGETSPGSQIPLSYGETPPLIKRAALLLVADYLTPLADGGGVGPSGPITKEKTRDQEVQYQAASSAASLQPDSLTGNPTVDRILGAFRSPLGMGAV